MIYIRFFIILLILLLLYAPAVHATASKSYDKARYEYIKNNHFAAIKFYKEALKKNPYFKEAQIGMGEVFYSLGNYDNALRYFKDLEGKFKFDVDIKLWIARTKIAQGRFDSAQSYILKALKLKPRNYEAYIIYGNLFSKKGYFARAVDLYKEAILIDGENDKAYLEIAKSYLKWDKGDKVLKYLNKAYLINDRNPETNLYFGKYFRRESNFLASEDYLKQALGLRANYTAAMDVLYEVLFELERFAESRDILRKLLSAGKSNTDYHYYLGVVYEKLNKPYLSLSILLDGIVLDKGSEVLRYKAEDIYRKYYWTNARVKDLGASLVDYWYNKGNSYLKQNLSHLALFAFRRGIRLSPKDIKMRLALSRILRSRGFIDAYYRELKLINSLKVDKDEKVNKDEKVDKVDKTDREERANKEDDKNKKKDSLDDGLDDEIKDELLFTDRALSRTISRREGISQYDEDKIEPKIALLPFSVNNTFEGHYSIENIYREFLYTALKMKDRLNVIFVDDDNKINEEDIINEKNVSFIIRGKLKELRGGIEVSLEISNARGGEVYKTFKMFQRGNDSFVMSAMHLASTVEASFPVFGKIIRKNYRDIVLNFGFRHNYKMGDEFYVLRPSVLPHLLKKSDLDNIVNDRSNLKYTLLSYKKSKQFGLDRIKITAIDENIAKGHLLTSDFFNEVNIGSYVIYVP